MKFLFSFFLLLGIAFYAWFQFWAGAKGMPYPASFAYANIFEMHRDPAIKFHTKKDTSALSLNAQEKEECIKSDFSQRYNHSFNDKIPQCNVAQPLFTNDFAECQSWRFEKCGGITVNKIFLRNEQKKAALIDVLENPCDYMPSAVEMQKKLSATPDQDMQAKRNFKRYLSAIKYMSCDDPVGKKIKLIISSEEDQNTSKIVKMVQDGNLKVGF